MTIFTTDRENQMAMNLESADLRKTHRLAWQHGTGVCGTIEHLLVVCTDAADGARRIAELLDADLAPHDAELFHEIAKERSEFGRRLTLLLGNRGCHRGIDPATTFSGSLLRWRLKIAERFPVGYHARDDRRNLLRIARRGSNIVTKAYSVAEARLARSDEHEEIHRQAEAVRRENLRIHYLARAM